MEKKVRQAPLNQAAQQRMERTKNTPFIRKPLGAPLI
jgi:hypothetical protein